MRRNLPLLFGLRLTSPNPALLPGFEQKCLGLPRQVQSLQRQSCLPCPRLLESPPTFSESPPSEPGSILIQARSYSNCARIRRFAKWQISILPGTNRRNSFGGEHIPAQAVNLVKLYWQLNRVSGASALAGSEAKVQFAPPAAAENRNEPSAVAGLRIQPQQN